MRKPTTIVHIGLGGVTALLALRNPGLAVLLFGSFALYEFWSERKGHPGGYADFWEGLLGLGVTATLVVLVRFFTAINALIWQA